MKGYGSFSGCQLNWESRRITEYLIYFVNLRTCWFHRYPQFSRGLSDQICQPFLCAICWGKGGSKDSQFRKIIKPKKNVQFTVDMPDVRKKESISAEQSFQLVHHWLCNPIPMMFVHSKGHWLNMQERVSGWGVVTSTPSAPLRFSPWSREGLPSCHPRNEPLISMFILAMVEWKISTGDLCVKHCKTVTFYYL